MCNQFSERILLLRKNNQISQSVLGDAIGLSKQTINDIEKGRSKTTLDRAKLLADYFNVSLDYLVGNTDNSNRNIDNNSQPTTNENNNSITEEELELLEDFRRLNKLEQNVIIGKISEMIYNKEVEENNNIEISNEFINIDIRDRISK